MSASDIKIVNPFDAQLVDAKQAVAAAENDLRNIKNKKRLAQDIIEHRLNRIINAPMTRLDWEVAKYEATRQTDKQDFKEQGDAYAGFGGGINWQNFDQAVEKLTVKIMESFSDPEKLREAYVAVLEHVREKRVSDQTAEILPSGTRTKKFDEFAEQYPELFKLGQKGIKLPATEVVDSYITALRKASAKAELREMVAIYRGKGVVLTEKDVPTTMTTEYRAEINDMLKQALQPLFVARRKHLSVFIKSISP